MESTHYSFDCYHLELKCNPERYHEACFKCCILFWKEKIGKSDVRVRSQFWLKSESNFDPKRSQYQTIGFFF